MIMIRNAKTLNYRRCARPTWVSKSAFGARHQLRADLKGNHVAAVRNNRSNMSGEHAFEPASGAWLIAHMML
jgi:hypothetical protein